MENKNIKIIYSSRLRDILLKIYMSHKDEVSKFLVNLEENSDYVYPLSYLDITDTEEEISFIQSSNLDKIKGDDAPWTPRTNYNELIWAHPSRNKIRVGRLILKLAPIFKSSDIENFVNCYKAEYKDSLKNLKFDIVEGSQILKYYSGNHYEKGNGSLNKSCMRHDQCQEYMELYKRNPDKIKMLVLYGKTKDTIRGRALLWFLDSPKNTVLLDRIYTKEDSDVILFKKYANDNNWLYKTAQTFNCTTVSIKGKESSVEMFVNIKGDFKYFPYIDTLLYYNKKERYLTNSENVYNENPDVVKLREIDGKESGNENFVYDVLNDVIINIVDSVFCYYGDGYTHKNSAVFVKHLDEYCFPNMIRYSKHSKKFVVIGKSIFSKNLDSFMDTNDVIKVYLSKDYKNQDYFSREDANKKYVQYYANGNYYHIDLMVKGYDDRYYFKDEYDKDTIEKLKNKDKTDLDYAIKNSQYLKKIGLDKKKKSILNVVKKSSSTSTSTTFTSTSSTSGVNWWESEGQRINTD
jgi:hypothetical protein